MTNVTEWVGWDAAMRLLRKGGVPYPWKAIQNWARQGQVDSKAGNIISDEGAFLTDDVLPKEAWLAKPRPTSGALRFSVPHAFDDGQPDTVLHILAPRFRKDHLVSLLPHLNADEVEAALADEIEANAKDAQAPPVKRTGGAKSDRAAWDAFWMAVVDLAAQERLSRAHFQDQTELRAEILEAIGEALADRTIKPVVSQIWNKWIEPTR